MTALYMLDTDICAFVLRRSSDSLLKRLLAVPVIQQVISVVTYAELLYGVQLSSKKKTNQSAVDALAGTTGDPRLVSGSGHALCGYSR